MTIAESRVQSIVGLFLIISQFIVLVTTVYLYVSGGFRFDEMTTLVSLLTPMFAVHTTTIVKFFVATRYTVSVHPTRVSWRFVFLALFFPVLFVACLITLMLLKVYSV